MKNLFVCHSQAQIILAVGLAKGRFWQDKNTLLLFKDFNLSKELLTSLNEVFNFVLVRTGGFPDKNKKWEKKIPILIRDVLFIKSNMANSYNKVFVVCDQNLQELLLIKRLYKLNRKTDFIWLEDGSYPYFLNVENKHGLNKNKFTVYLRKVLFKYFFRLGFVYNFQGNYMSGNKNLKQAYLTMPNCARDIFESKKLIRIKKHEYLSGINHMYSKSNTLKHQYGDVIIVFDKFDTYNNADKIKEITASILKLAFLKNKRVSFKLHPREEELDLSFLQGAIQLDRNFGFEFYVKNIVESKRDNIKVFGFKSTTLQVARFFNLETISLFPLIEEEIRDLSGFYERIGVRLPVNIDKAGELI